MGFNSAFEGLISIKIGAIYKSNVYVVGVLYAQFENFY